MRMQWTGSLTEISIRQQEDSKKKESRYKKNVVYTH